MIPMRGAGRDYQLAEKTTDFGGVYVMPCSRAGRNQYTVCVNNEVLRNRKDGNPMRFDTPKAAERAGRKAMASL